MFYVVVVRVMTFVVAVVVMTHSLLDLRFSVVLGQGEGQGVFLCLCFWVLVWTSFGSCNYSSLF